MIIEIGFACYECASVVSVRLVRAIKKTNVDIISVLGYFVSSWANQSKLLLKTGGYGTRL